MRVLFDSHLLVWALTDDPQLRLAARALLRDPDIDPLFSIASIWEITIKYGLGRTDFQVHPRIMRRNLLADGYGELGISADHSFALLELPPIHRDPFDRILIAQSRAEGIMLATADETVASYGGLVRLV